MFKKFNLDSFRMQFIRTGKDTGSLFCQDRDTTRYKNIGFKSSLVSFSKEKNPVAIVISILGLILNRKIDSLLDQVNDIQKDIQSVQECIHRWNETFT